MAKTFMGVRLRSLRAERGMTQAALAQALELSPSYLNQIEQDQRPLTVAVLLKIHKVLGVDIQQFSEDEEARLLAQLRDALAAMPQPEGAVPLPELRELASRLPQPGVNCHLSSKVKDYFLAGPIGIGFHQPQSVLASNRTVDNQRIGGGDSILHARFFRKYLHTARHPGRILHNEIARAQRKDNVLAPLV